MNVLVAQTDTNYRLLLSQGEIPYDIITSGFDRFHKKEAALWQSLSELKSEQRERVLSGVSIDYHDADALFRSGLVLFGDSVTHYVNSVAAHLLENERSLKDSLQFYVIKRTNVETFVTREGSVFVSLGLIAELENEAQLAFFLARSIAIYKMKLFRNSQLPERTGLEPDIIEKNEIKKVNIDEVIASLMELKPADDERVDDVAIALSAKSGYSRVAAEFCFDILYYDYLPFLEDPFDPLVFQHNELVIPDTLLLKNIPEVPLLNLEYTEGNHLIYRKDRLVKEHNYAKADGELFRLDRSLFNCIQRRSRDEVIHLNLLQGEYIHAMLHAQGMAKEYGMSRYYEESVAKALYAISMIKSIPEQIFQYDKEKVSCGSAAACYYFFYKLTPIQCNLIAIRHLMELENKYHSAFFGRMIDDLIIRGTKQHLLSQLSVEKGLELITELKQTTMNKKQDVYRRYEAKHDVIANDTMSLSADSISNGAKNDKLRMAGTDNRLKSELSELTLIERDSVLQSLEVLQYYAFVGMDCRDLFERINRLTPENPYAYDKTGMKSYEIENKNRQLDEERERKKQFLLKNAGKLGAKKLIFVPVQIFLDYKSIQKAFEELPSVDSAYTDVIERTMMSNKMEGYYLFPHQFEQTEITSYNDMCLLNQLNWETERLASEKIQMIPLLSEVTSSLVARLGCRYAVFGNVNCWRSKKWYYAGQLWFGFLFVPVAIIPMFILPSYRTQYTQHVIDIETGQIQWYYQKRLGRKSGKGAFRKLAKDVISEMSRTAKQ